MSSLKNVILHEPQCNNMYIVSSEDHSNANAYATSALVLHAVCLFVCLFVMHCCRYIWEAEGLIKEWRPASVELDLHDTVLPAHIYVIVENHEDYPGEFAMDDVTWASGECMEGRNCSFFDNNYNQSYML